VINKIKLNENVIILVSGFFSLSQGTPIHFSRNIVWETLFDVELALRVRFKLSRICLSQLLSRGTLCRV
jgi:hypothetical protein